MEIVRTKKKILRHNVGTDREASGKKLYEEGRVIHLEADNYNVISAKDFKKWYYVILSHHGNACTCQDWQNRQLDCKHIIAARYDKDTKAKKYSDGVNSWKSVGIIQ